MDISLGPNLTIGPSFSCAACIVRLFVAMKRRQVIHAEEMGAVKCALGIRAKGDKNAGYRMYLYIRADNAPNMQAICMCEIAIWTDSRLGYVDISPSFNTTQTQVRGFLL
jgi:hypothetical protein